MPTKERTETQLLRLISPTRPCRWKSRSCAPTATKAKNVSADYLNTFYRTFADVKDEVFDGVIITGAPVEKLDFHDVQYWDELTEIMQLGG